VDRVVLIYSDRAPRALRLNRTVSASAGPIQVPLGDAKDVTRVIITGHSSWGSAVAIDAI
jgi:hypothetical protein